MKRWLSFSFMIPFGLVLIAGGAQAAAAPPNSVDRFVAGDANGLRPPAFFERNVGQAGKSVQFLSRGLHSTLYVMEDGESLLQTGGGSLRIN